ncbi:MAG TPA: glutamate-5-semialdehyde dehydrogenase [Phycisphaerales bacterium]|nr:glutamate-5-semialdehyde dehydrogenase [Phycisphaerales bacterium]HCD31451.1 glutamate-5-semialdehyde dehydrogenase [Phycisphaerales bacterium]|tara:strand:- start:954 stop:2243 length:1290 start_codon:yes stop_codon:yes gene_type:complete
MSSTITENQITDTQAYCQQLADKAYAASRSLSGVASQQRIDALNAIATRIEASAEFLKSENAKDLAAGEANGLSSAMLDRLKIDDTRIASIAGSVREIASQTDPLGQIIEGRVLPNGLKLSKVRVPLGVVLIIFESRPNVTSDAAVLCIKSGNATILRGGKEAIHSNNALAQCVRGGLEDAGINPDVVQLVQTTDRAAVGALLKMDNRIDLAIPRGGKSLIKAVVEQAHIPVIKHYTGNCHVYVDNVCDEQMAIDICINAKTQRTGVCNATETILLHKDVVASGLGKKICDALIAKGVEIRGDASIAKLNDKIKAATPQDWDEEYLDMIVAMKTVDSLADAATHINDHGSRHTDAIVTNDVNHADQFVQSVDTANTFVNCSTRFSDGGEYGLGAEIGISTDKLHARGPMGAADLTTYKWVIYGNGQVRG